MSLPDKIVITGTSGCGKTTLGRKLAALFGKKFIDLDDLYWLPGWTPRPDEEFAELLRKEISSDRWIICGNYSRARSLVWGKADMIIWIDAPLFTCLWRAFKRSLWRWIAKEPCCNGNFETPVRIFGKNSILLWVWNTYPRRKKAYAEFFANHSGKQKLVCLRTDREISVFIKKLANTRA